MGFSAAVFVGVAIYGAAEQHHQAEQARKAQEAAANEQRKARQEQEAVNSQKRAEERRSQLREERVRRARIIQASANTGTIGSSGEMGALGNLSTQADAALGSNLGLAMHGSNISAFNQSAADFLGSANNHMVSANEWGQISSISLQAAGAAYGMGKAPAGTTAAQGSSIGPSTGTIQEAGLQSSGAFTSPIS